MVDFAALYTQTEPFIRVGKIIVVVLVVFLLFNFLLTFVRRRLLNRAKTKHQISNVEIFSMIIKYVFLGIVVLIAIFSYSGSWSGLGLTAGLLSAALGWALQKPITGIAAWIMIVSKRPFEIGDRIIVGDVKGDVIDISLTHIYMKEIGGLVGGEESSGRMVMIPNNTLFDYNIINYTLQDEYVLDQVVTSVTYESNVDKAMKICEDAADDNLEEFIHKMKKQPFVRIEFKPSGIDVYVRYFVPVRRLQEISSKITKDIYDKIRKIKAVEIAYPHTEVVYRKK